MALPRDDSVPAAKRGAIAARMSAAVRTGHAARTRLFLDEASASRTRGALPPLGAAAA